INSTDEAAAWARRKLSTKNTLTAGDARIVEEKFQAKILSIGDGEGPTEPCDPLSARNVMPADQSDSDDSQKTSKLSGKPPRKSAVRALGKTVRVRDRAPEVCVPAGMPCLRPNAVGSASPDVYATSSPRTQSQR